jgi:hydroxymethylpyrimidine/phosphomethylpyrimidine kinase
LKTFHQWGVYGEAVVTLVTVQNTRRVSRVEVMPADLVAEQLRAVMEDLAPRAAKTGALGNAAVVREVARAAAGFSFLLVVDPVMISKHGAPLMDADAAAVLCAELLPRAALVTPNIPEAEALAGFPVRTEGDVRRAAEAIHKLGARAVLVKGGHRHGAADDVLFDGDRLEVFAGQRFSTPHTHGTGCTYSAAITAGLARGLQLPQAVRAAKAFIAEAIRTNPGLGGGCGPVNHFAIVNF